MTWDWNFCGTGMYTFVVRPLSIKGETVSDGCINLKWRRWFLFLFLSFVLQWTRWKQHPATCGLTVLVVWQELFGWKARPTTRRVRCQKSQVFLTQFSSNSSNHPGWDFAVYSEKWHLIMHHIWLIWRWMKVVSQKGETPWLCHP